MINTIFREGLFGGKVVLITGGGTGIGLRAAREFGKLGAKIVIASRKQEKLNGGLEVLKEDGIEAIAVECNIRNEESIQNCVKECMDQFGTIDILVNNGGGQFPSPAEVINRKGWHAVVETNLTGTFFLTQQVFNEAFSKNGGAVVNILMNHRNGFPMMAHSAAARSGVENLTKTLSTEWGRYGVRINSIMPGIIDSAGLKSYAPQFQEMVYAYGKNNQTNRLGTEAELVAAIVFLASPGASFITGITMAVDGGESLYTPLYPPVENEKNPAHRDEK
ncbi:MAG: SDR family oxidoreductase [Flavobacteriales bacterium]|nr:SDR family oxidoreductase [Flavobacteriales bacterium]